jgi:hypothetical protein
MYRSPSGRSRCLRLTVTGCWATGGVGRPTADELGVERMVAGTVIRT